MKILLILALGLSNLGQAQAVAQNRAGRANVLKHSFKSPETLWFLAQLYYGKGKLYPKIMQANALRSADGIQEGRTLLIPDSQYGHNQKSLAKRYAELMQKRQNLLNKKAELQAGSTAVPEVMQNKRIKELERLEIEFPARTANQELGN